MSEEIDDTVGEQKSGYIEIDVRENIHIFLIMPRKKRKILTHVYGVYCKYLWTHSQKHPAKVLESHHKKSLRKYLSR